MGAEPRRTIRVSGESIRGSPFLTRTGRTIRPTNSCDSSAAWPRPIPKRWPICADSSHVFSGYNLYHVCNANGLSAASMELSSDLDEVIEERLDKHNQLHITEWRELTQGIPRRFLFSPPAMMGEVGHDDRRRDRE